MNLLWQGARGAAVAEFQARLRALGFPCDGDDGVFDSATAKALAAFQKSRGIFADGIAGPQTFRELDIAAHAVKAAGAAGATRTAKASSPDKTKVFISYSHADEKWLNMLKIHLAPLERHGNLAIWDDQRLAPGTKWREQIQAGIQASRIAILLISANFLASEFISQNELPPLLSAAESGGTTILPVIISPCVLGDLAEYQSVNPPSKPLCDLGRGDRDRVWVKVVETITAALNS